MATSTDATVQDYLAATPTTSAEIRSFTSGSTGDAASSGEAIKERDASDTEIGLETGSESGDEQLFRATKEGARKIAELTSDDEYETLVSQRRMLVNKQLESHLSRSEILQLRLIEWTINCVESSRAGLNVDSLQSIAKAHEIIATRVTRTAEQLQAIVDAEEARNREASRNRFRRFA